MCVLFYAGITTNIIMQFLFLKTFVWNQCAVSLAMTHEVGLLLLKAEARIRCQAEAGGTYGK
jgi:hypothetical protein